jgi:hypothetical protein
MRSPCQDRFDLLSFGGFIHRTSSYILFREGRTKPALRKSGWTACASHAYALFRAGWFLHPILKTGRRQYLQKTIALPRFILLNTPPFRFFVAFRDDRET